MATRWRYDFTAHFVEAKCGEVRAKSATRRAATAERDAIRCRAVKKIGCPSIATLDFLLMAGDAPGGELLVGGAGNNERKDCCRRRRVLLAILFVSPSWPPPQWLDAATVRSLDGDG